MLVRDGDTHAVWDEQSEYKQVSNVGWTLEESSKAFVADSQGAELTLQFHVVDKKCVALSVCPTKGLVCIIAVRCLYAISAFQYTLTCRGALFPVHGLVPAANKQGLCLWRWGACPLTCYARQLCRCF